MNKITVKIDGMMCGMCESHVSDAIRQVFPVKKVTASHSKGEAVILTETDITEQQLHTVLDPTGYEVKGVTAEPYEKKGLFGFLKKGQ
jgi:copper chaperone CopZ